MAAVRSGYLIGRGLARMKTLAAKPIIVALLAALAGVAHVYAQGVQVANDGWQDYRLRQSHERVAVRLRRIVSVRMLRQ